MENNTGYQIVYAPIPKDIEDTYEVKECYLVEKKTKYHADGSSTNEYKVVTKSSGEPVFNAFTHEHKNSITVHIVSRDIDVIKRHVNRLRFNKIMNEMSSKCSLESIEIYKKYKDEILELISDMDMTGLQ